MMPPPSLETARSLGTTTRTKLDRNRPSQLWRRWWRQQSPASQDRFATLGPLISVILFLIVIAAAFWYLRNEEFDRARESVKRDTEVVQQQLRLRLVENQEKLTRLARELGTRTLNEGEFLEKANAFVQTHPEIISLSWSQADHTIKASQISPNLPLDLMRGLSLSLSSATDITNFGNTGLGNNFQPLLGKEAESAFSAAKASHQAVYSLPLSNSMDMQVIQVHIPIMAKTGFAGTLIAEYSIEGLLHHIVSHEIASRHEMSLLEYNGHALASTVIAGSSPSPDSSVVHEVIVTPIDSGIILRGRGYRTSFGLIGNTLFWMVIALSGFTVWMLLGTWRHMRRRMDMQQTLMRETNFRRAMENSMLTGMRVIDKEGRITYVNPAFCAMTGFHESELVGCMPPYPYWTPDRIEENNRLFQQELQGRSPAGGVEVRIMRKNGTHFDARMYVSPLIDVQGQQSGWMSSVTNITEAKRVRDQLSAAHERFTTVLEGLDAAVSVFSVLRGELLFANRSYRLWFGTDAKGHAMLAGNTLEQAPLASVSQDIDAEDAVDNLAGLNTQWLTETAPDSHEVYIENLRKWFDVRARYIQWTDGRLAQMLIATDITARRQAEEQAAQQAEKAQVSSRLITMGEMASSVAHELNQPLTAISNYCTGMVSRVKNQTINDEDLIAALEKTARQAQRAGQVIHRIRSFVKRSEPQRQATQVRNVIEDVLELASIELKRRKVVINSQLGVNLPTLFIDPILIEQVLLNLLKNAAEAIDNANMSSSRRRIDLSVTTQTPTENETWVQFSVMDTGPGLKPEVMERVYESFFSTKADGMGIGLNLCRSIIESHHGRIQAENIYNGSEVMGCHFSFTIPVGKEADTHTTASFSSSLDLTAKTL